MPVSALVVIWVPHRSYEAVWLERHRPNAVRAHAVASSWYHAHIAPRVIVLAS
jgi:hypothetical protein